MNPRCQSCLPGNEGSGVVRVEGLEPPWIAPPDPKSGMSTNFTTPASICGHFFLYFPLTIPNAKWLLVKKGVQIYRYFITINQFSQNSQELKKDFLRFKKKIE